MSKGYKFANFDNFQSVENMNPIIRQQQYAYNGRMFIPFDIFILYIYIYIYL